MKNLIFPFLLAGFCLYLEACTSKPELNTDLKVELAQILETDQKYRSHLGRVNSDSVFRDSLNLHAFARLYGYVRFFHPSDEAAAVDWDRFALHGIKVVRNAPSMDALRAHLDSLFRPIAPSLVLYREGDPLSPLTHVPDDTSGLEQVAWQHQGVLVAPQRRQTYWSVRTNRVAEKVEGQVGTAILTQAIDAAPYQGRRVRLRANVRAETRGAGNQAQLWLRIDRPDQAMGFFDNMADRPVTYAAWQRYEITGTVAEDAERIVFGGIARGLGHFRFDDFELAVANGDDWIPIAIGDPGFESKEPPMTPGNPRGALNPETHGRWIVIAPGFEYVTDSTAAEGAHAAAFRTRTTTQSEPLFEQTPDPGETLDRPLGNGLHVRFPVSLYSDGYGTFPRAERAALERLSAALAAIDLGSSASPDEEHVRLAAVVIAWNVFRHFYPYNDVVNIDWDTELDRALRGALAARDGAEFMTTLRRLVAALGDGHGNVTHYRYNPSGGIPWNVEWIEKRPVVVASEDSTLQQGDIVLAIDGVPADRLVHEEAALISGSPQWKYHRAMWSIGLGERGSIARVRVDRDGTTLELDVTRDRRRVVREFDRPIIEEIEDEIWYVDLDRAPWTEIDSVIDTLAAAKGVIFDLRGYPAGNHQVLQHLLEAPDTSMAWMRIPEYVYPNGEPVSYRRLGWEMQPAEPHIGGRVVFITDGRAISYAESVMGFVEHYRLGEIVGGPTAGANGNVNPFNLPGGFVLNWTGMRVVKHGGSQHHLVGIQPTVSVSRTVEGVRAGRDEMLEVALEVVRK